MNGNDTLPPKLEHCPARLNPLAAARTDSLAFRFPIANWEKQLDRLQSLNFRATICGPHGSGKTTLLDQLPMRLLETGRIAWRTRPPLRRRDQKQFLAACLDQPPGTVLLVDSAEQLSRWHWVALVRESARRHQGLIATIHRPSLLLPTWVRTTTSPELFLELLAELVPHVDADWRVVALASYRRHRGNIRDAFRELYDWCWSTGRQ